MTLSTTRGTAAWAGLFMLVAAGAQAAEPDFTFRIPLETRDIPDTVTGVTVSCAIRDAAHKTLEFARVHFSELEIAKSVIVEINFKDRAKVGLAKSWECLLFLTQPDGQGGQPVEPGEACNQENIWYWYMCGRNGEPFRNSVSGRIE